MAVYETDEASILSRVLSRVPDQVEATAVKPWDLEKAAEAKPEPESDPTWRLQAIAGETRLTSNFGKVPAQLLRIGDVVRTRQRRFVPVRNIREYKLDQGFLDAHPEALPVLIPRGSLAGKLPYQDVYLSPAQIMNIGSERIRPEPIRARDVLRACHMTDARSGMVAYYQIILEHADDVDCDGIWVRCGA